MMKTSKFYNRNTNLPHRPFPFVSFGGEKGNHPLLRATQCECQHECSVSFQDASRIESVAAISRGWTLGQSEIDERNPEYRIPSAMLRKSSLYVTAKQIGFSCSSRYCFYTLQLQTAFDVK